MATEEKENPYQGGQGTGGKFRKRPFRKTQTTPYDRPPTSLRNPSSNSCNGSWLTKLVDPAHRLITRGAHSLFSSLLRKRLPPPPPDSSVTKQEVTHNHQQEAAFVANISSDEQHRRVDENNVQINCSDGAGLTELEKLLKQKTFTRAEIDHLTALMRSRTVNAPIKEEEKRTEAVPSKPMLPCRQKEEHPKTPTIENVFGNRLILTPHATSIVPIEDAASPAELAKAYMGNKNSNASSSMLGMRSPALGKDPTPIKSEYFPYKSPIIPIVPRATKHVAVHEKGFVTPRSHGRSAIYSMARTPYARVYPSSTLKCGTGRLPIQGNPSSSTQPALDHDMLSGSKQGVLKHRSLALDNDIGSVGPIRRVRHKSNLLYSKGSELPLAGSALSVSRSGLGIDAAQKPSSSILPDEVKHSPMKSSEENMDDNKLSISFPPFSSKSSERASKILHQLDKLVSPKDKSPESRLPITNDNSSLKLSPSMLHGQAIRSMDMADSSKSLDNIKGSKFDGTFRNLCASAQNQKFVSDRDKVENGPLKLHAPSDELVSVVAATDATNPRNQVPPTGKTMDTDMIKSGSHPTQKRRAFCISAHKNFLDLDDDAYPNGAVSSFPPTEENTSSTAKLEKISSGSEAVAQENSSTLSVVMPSKSLVTDGEAHARTASIMSSISDSTCMPTPTAVTAVTMTSFGSDISASPNGSIANPSLFDFGNKMASSTELTATGAPSKEMTKAAPMFGLDKVVSSKEPGADAPLVNFGTNKNVHRVPSMPFTASTSVSGESTPKFGASSDSHLGCSISSTTVTGATDSMQKVRESDIGNAEANADAGLSVGASEVAVSSAAAASLTSATSIFTFGQNSSQNNGFLASGPSFSSFPSLISNNFSSSTSLSHSASCGNNATAASTGISTAAPTNVALSNSSSVFGAQAPPSTSGFATYTQTHSVPNTSLSSGNSLFSSSSSAANVSFSSGRSLFIPFSSATNTSFSSGSSLFPSSSSTNIFNSGSTFGLGTSASSSALNSISSNSSTSSTLFGTPSQQPGKSPFGSTFSSSSSSGFSVGTSTASFASTSSPMMFSSTTSASAPQFSFTSAAATTSTQSAFGSPNPVFSFASAAVNNHQMSMAQTTPPVTPTFCHPPSPVQSNFVFGASSQSGTNPFQSGNQQNIAPQNPSPFQASGSLEINGGGGSFSLGSGGGDKSGRKFLRVKHRQRTKK